MKDGGFERGHEGRGAARSRSGTRHRVDPLWPGRTRFGTRTNTTPGVGTADPMSATRNRRPYECHASDNRVSQTMATEHRSDASTDMRFAERAVTRGSVNGRRLGVNPRAPSNRRK
jgi:hypothetical protein